MDNTLSDVNNFGEDGGALGTLIVAGAAVGGILVTCVVNWFRNKGAMAELKELRKTVQMLQCATKPQILMAAEMATGKKVEELEKLVQGLIGNTKPQSPLNTAAATA